MNENQNNTQPTRRDAVARIFRANPEIRLGTISDEGEVTISLRLRALSISLPYLKANPIFATHAFADFFGELVIYRNLEFFKTLIGGMPDYSIKARKHRHQHCGFQADSYEIRVKFHLSLVHDIMNRDLAAMLAEDTSVESGH